VMRGEPAGQRPITPLRSFARACLLDLYHRYPSIITVR
jgi:hypothetical protein